MKLNHQAVGAFGERAVEAELLRRGWIPANVNATVKNAADFDIYVVKQGHTVHLRVRACGPDSRAFQFGGFDPSKQVNVGKFSDTDFTVLVKHLHRIELEISFMSFRRVWCEKKLR